MSSVDHGQENEPAVAAAEQITLEGSVGSDTDTGAPNKNDSVTAHGLDYQHHARSNSVKKPTTFKAVSVTKNFLAKAGTPPTPNSKPNSENLPATVNGAGAGLQALRPRLVAKSSGTKQAKGHYGEPNGAGPDPMQVWNRNRATPQHPPKHLTDEELKQQYGIHLATRIQADGDGKEAKWADIDDEDDWAPDTIEWNDGTKIDLSKHDSAALLAEQKAGEEAAKRREEEERKAKLAKATAEKKPTTSVGPNATVLKPRSQLQAKPGSPLVLKTPTEKPTLVSKPASATPTKSPWAPLPTIDKIPPVEINPPVSQSVPRPQPNGILPSPVAETPSHPALEIAADSFKRGGPESQKDIIGQLYNDKSGKYEPAATGRRGSVRRDGNFRAPSVLQRTGPAPDASAIIEGNRVGQDDEEFEIRRKSSAISADGSGSARRYSDRHGSQHSQATMSPSAAHAQLAVESPSSDGRTSGAYRAGHGSGPPGSATDRDDVALQKQMMKEKRELAIKRRKEQEEREEAEKKERIRKKLETLGPVPESEKKESVPSVTIERRPAEGLSDQTEAPAAARAQQSEPLRAEAVSPAMTPSKSLKSPPKPPVPNASGEPLQYGMMKVHAPGPRDPLQQVHDTLTAEKLKQQGPTSRFHRSSFDAQPEALRVAEKSPEKPTVQAPLKPEAVHAGFDQRDRIDSDFLRHSQNQRQLPPGFEAKPQEDLELASPLLNGSLTPNQADHLFSRSPELSSHRNMSEVRQQPWNEGPRDARLYSGFSGQQFGRDTSSVWGAPNQSRNSLFDRTVQRPLSRHQDQYASPALAPIGPPKHFQHNKEARDARSIHSGSPATGFEDSQTVPSYPLGDQFTGDRRERSSRLVNGEQRLPSPHLAAGAQFDQQRNESLSHLHARDTSLSLGAWKDYPGMVQSKEAEEARQYHLERQARKAEEARTGTTQQASIQYKEKWSQVKVPERGLGREIIGVHRQLHTPGSTGPAIPPAEIRGPSFVHPTDLPSTLPGGLGRGSRFFPTAGRFQGHQQPAAPFSPFYRRNDSPPPPDDAAHPVLSSADPQRVVVRLPLMDEVPYLSDVDTVPKVKLPPSLGTPTSSPRPALAQTLSLRPAPQGLVNNPSWQERFNSMLGNRKVSMTRSSEGSEGKVSQVIDFSATKEPLDPPSPEVTAAVALPPRGVRSHQTPRTAPLYAKVDSRNAFDEEALFEPEAGSMPAVRFPASLGHRPWQDKPLRRTPAPKSLPPSSEVDAVSQEILTLPPMFDITSTMLLIFINLQGMSASKSKSMKAPLGITPPPKEVARQPQSAPNAPTSYPSKPRQQGHSPRHREPSGHYGTHQKPGHGPSQNKRAGTSGPRNNFRHGSQQHAVAT